MLQHNPEAVLTFRVNLPPARYGDAAALRTFQTILEERLAAIPGVASVGSTSNLPLAGLDNDTRFLIEGRPVPPPTQSQGVWYRRVSAGRFETLHIPVIRGRGILDSDAASPQT